MNLAVIQARYHEMYPFMIGFYSRNSAVLRMAGTVGNTVAHQSAFASLGSVCRKATPLRHSEGGSAIITEAFLERNKEKRRLKEAPWVSDV